MQLRGCGTALVTPFHQDGSVDDAALRSLVAWQVESGIDFLVPCGTTGETPTLTHDEWLCVIDTTIEAVAGRVPIVAGATSNSTHDAVEKAKEVATRSRRQKKSPPAPMLTPSSPRRLTTTSPRRRASTGTSRQSPRPSATSRSFFTMCPAAPERIWNRQHWRGWPRFQTSWE